MAEEESTDEQVDEKDQVDSGVVHDAGTDGIDDSGLRRSSLMGTRPDSPTPLRNQIGVLRYEYRSPDASGRPYGPILRRFRREGGEDKIPSPAAAREG